MVLFGVESRKTRVCFKQEIYAKIKNSLAWRRFKEDENFFRDV